ncbi:MAG: hypothetical protein WD738_02120 [Pirellulales bacterium]
MKPYMINGWRVIAVAVAIGLVVLRASWAQERNERPTYGERPSAAAIAEYPHIKAMKFLEDPNSMTAIRNAAEELNDAEDDDAKGKAEERLRELLSNYFEDDMARRQTELEDIEKRLSKLREQLDRRRTKKQDIIDLQVKVLINEAEGLGFFNNTTQSSFLFTPPGNPFKITGPTFHLPPTHPRVAVPGAAPTPPATPARAAAPTPTSTPRPSALDVPR